MKPVSQINKESSSYCYRSIRLPKGNAILSIASQDDNVLPLTEWCSEEKVSTQFKYCKMVMKLELIVLTFVRSLCECNFDLYVESLQNLAPWPFSLEHTHYSRWLSVYLRT